MVETTGTFMALGAATDTKVSGKKLARGVLCDGIGSAFLPLLGSPPVSTFAQNVGVISLTGVATGHVVALTGGTTSSAPLYISPNDWRLDDSIEAARGSMSVGQSQGGLPPDRVVGRKGAILKDTQRLIET